MGEFDMTGKNSIFSPKSMRAYIENRSRFENYDEDMGFDPEKSIPWLDEEDFFGLQHTPPSVDSPWSTYMVLPVAAIVVWLFVRLPPQLVSRRAAFGGDLAAKHFV